MNIETNSNDLQEEIKEIHESKKAIQESENKTPSKIKTTISTTIVIAIFNAYIYFAGYTYFKSKMLSLGFDSAKIEDNIGSVYFYAYECFGYLVNDGLLPLLKGIDFYNFVKLLPIPIIAVFLTAIYIVFIDNKKFNDYCSKKIKKIGKKSAFVTLGLIISITGLSLIFIFVFALIILIFMFFIYLSIPMLLADQAANEEIMNFTCEPPNFSDVKKENKMKLLGCTTIVLTDKSVVTGGIYYADDTNIYMLIEDKQPSPEKAVPIARTVPIDQIQERSQKIYINQNKLKKIKAKN
jgi:hypothetical protein